MALTEFELIDRFFSNMVPAPLGVRGAGEAGIALGVGDDCALLQAPAGHQLAVTTDTLVAGVHFPAGADPHLLAQRALRVNLSDLAAMGAEPLAFTLAVTLPAADERWLEAFAGGLREDAERFRIGLAGGDTTRGRDLVITIQAMGTVPAGQALTRAGAHPGDRIFVSGRLGDAAAALAILGKAAGAASGAEQRRLQRYWLPEPRLALGSVLRGMATAAIDISDGLAADLGHILARSGCGALIDPQRIPTAIDDDCPADLAIERALHGGDDYELCFTVAPTRLADLRRAARSLPVELADIGEITARPGLRAWDGETETPLPGHGFTHF